MCQLKSYINLNKIVTEEKRIGKNYFFTYIQLSTYFFEKTKTCLNVLLNKQHFIIKYKKKFINGEVCEK